MNILTADEIETILAAFRTLGDAGYSHGEDVAALRAKLETWLERKRRLEEVP